MGHHEICSVPLGKRSGETQRPLSVAGEVSEYRYFLELNMMRQSHRRDGHGVHRDPPLPTLAVLATLDVPRVDAHNNDSSLTIIE